MKVTINNKINLFVSFIEYLQLYDCIIPEQDLILLEYFNMPNFKMTKEIMKIFNERYTQYNLWA